MSSPANRTALRAEENRPAPPSQQHKASAVMGPTPYSCPASARAPRSCPAAFTSCRRRASSSPSVTSSIRRYSVICC